MGSGSAADGDGEVAKDWLSGEEGEEVGVKGDGESEGAEAEAEDPSGGPAEEHVDAVGAHTVGERGVGADLEADA